MATRLLLTLVRVGLLLRLFLPFCQATSLSHSPYQQLVIEDAENVSYNMLYALHYMLKQPKSVCLNPLIKNRSQRNTITITIIVLDVMIMTLKSRVAH